MIKIPEYTDGCFYLYKMQQDTEEDYPKTILENRNMIIWFREISVFDRIRYEFEQGNKEITMKVRIPLFKGIDSKFVCVIDGKQHQIYNVAHVKDKYGFRETELTLIRPEMEMDIK